MPFLYSFLGFNLLVQLASALLFTDVLYGWLHERQIYSQSTDHHRSAPASYSSMLLEALLTLPPQAGLSARQTSCILLTRAVSYGSLPPAHEHLEGQDRDRLVHLSIFSIMRRAHRCSPLGFSQLS